MNCRICSAETRFFARNQILNKHTIAYFKCADCGFVQTEDPVFWVNEAYIKPINQFDTGLVNRNLFLARIAKAVIIAFFKPDGKFLDYGGGYGLFVRLMRDSGFNFYHYDKYCENLFARDFEHHLSNQYELITAFEVFEHLICPQNDIQRMLTFSKSILFTTEIIPKNNPKPDEWWYYGLPHGQHVSFYAHKTLETIAQRLSLNIYSDCQSIHLLTTKRIHPAVFKVLVLSIRKISDILNRILIRKQL